MNSSEPEIRPVIADDTTAAFAIGLSDRFELGFAYIANRQMDFDNILQRPFYNRFPSGITTIENGM